MRKTNQMRNNRLLKVLASLIAISLSAVVLHKIGNGRETLPTHGEPQGCIVYLDNRKAKCYSPDQESPVLLRGSQVDILANTDNLLGHPNMPNSAVFISRFGPSGLVHTEKPLGRISLSTNQLLGQRLGVASAFKWRLYNNKLYVVLGRARKSKIVCVDLHGSSSARALPDLPRNLAGPKDDWSAAPSIYDTKIVFSVPVEAGNHPIVVVDTVKRTFEKVAEGLNPVWSPDGARIAFSGAGLNVSFVDVASGTITRLAVCRRSLVSVLSPIGTPLWIDRLAWLDNKTVACDLIRRSIWQRKLFIVRLPTGKTISLPLAADPATWAWVPQCGN